MSGLALLGDYLYSQLKPWLFRLDPELVHERCTKLIGLIQRHPLLLECLMLASSRPRAPTKALGLVFDSPFGLAAGFDKNAEYTAFFEALGFGHMECGSVTYCAGPGNPKPRLFRITEEDAVLNRMGLNNKGAAVVAETLASRVPTAAGFKVGINIAKTHNPDIFGEAGIADIIACFSLVAESADFITLNISCPNTREGKTFEDPATLRILLHELSQRNSTKVPLALKLSPGSTATELDSVIDLSLQNGVRALVCSNTRRDPRLGGGGLSGAPLWPDTLRTLKHIKQHSSLEVIACGGINSRDRAQEALDEGASLIQMFSALVYEGPGFISKLNTQTKRPGRTLSHPASQIRSDL